MYIRPDYLQTGDQVVIIAPAGRIKKNGLDEAIMQLEKWGLKVSLGQHIDDGYNYFSAPDSYRLIDLQTSIDSTEYKAIFCARGGYGITRIIDQVDFSMLKKFPKWITGFSDVTTLHLALSHHDLQSIHSIMPTGFELAHKDSIESFRKLLFGESHVVEIEPNEYNRKGKEEASIIGGNLSLLSASLGTIHELETKDKILFIEEIDEYLYKVDRMLGQMKRSRKLDGLKGLVIGHMSGMKDTSVPFGMNINQLIYDHVAQYNYPILFNAPIGHEAYNLPVIQEGEYFLEVKSSGGKLSLL